MGRVCLSSALLKEALSLPKSWEVVGAEWDFKSASTLLYLEGTGLPDVEEGGRIPPITLAYQRD